MVKKFNSFFLQNVKNALGVQTYNLSCEQNKLHCELTLVLSRFFGDRLISMGYYTEGGIYGDKTGDIYSLLIKIIKLAEDNNVDFIEFRGGLNPKEIIALQNQANNNSGDQDLLSEMIIRDNIYANFKKYLPSDLDILTSIPRKKRADIRKALDNPHLLFCSKIGIEDFYDLFTVAQRDHGTPVQSKKYFEGLMADNQYSRLYGIRYNGKVVAASLCFTYENALKVYYGAADPEFTKLHVYDLLYYSLMLEAQNQDLIFDFGRSKYDTGSFKYKTLWGFTPEPSTHYILPICMEPDKIPDIRANNPAYSTKIKLWQKLPLFIANLLGPIIIKHIG